MNLKTIASQLDSKIKYIAIGSWDIHDFLEEIKISNLSSDYDSIDFDPIITDEEFSVGHFLNYLEKQIWVAPEIRQGYFKVYIKETKPINSSSNKDNNWSVEILEKDVANVDRILNLQSFI